MDKIVVRSKHDPRFEIHVYENGSYFTEDSKLVQNPGKEIPQRVLDELRTNGTVVFKIFKTI